MYEIRFRSAAAEREFNRQPTKVRERFRARLLSLRADPFQHGVVKLKGLGYRIREGDYRLTFDVDRKKLTLIILNIGHRREVYKRARRRRSKS